MGYVVKMLKPLYGPKDAGTYWNAAYSGDWRQKVGVSPSTLDPCFITTTCNQAKDAPYGITAILVDATFMTGNKKLAINEDPSTATTIWDRHIPSLADRRLSLRSADPSRSRWCTVYIKTNLY
jgi:hypothetical protein